MSREQAEEIKRLLCALAEKDAEIGWHKGRADVAAAQLLSESRALRAAEQKVAEKDAEIERLKQDAKDHGIYGCNAVVGGHGGCHHADCDIGKAEHREMKLERQLHAAEKTLERVREWTECRREYGTPYGEDSALTLKDLKHVFTTAQAEVRAILDDKEASDDTSNN